MACKKNKIHILKYLVIDLGINIYNLKYDNNALNYACGFNNDTEIIKYLIIDLNFDVYKKTHFDHDALFSALENSDKNISFFLIEILRMEIKIYKHMFHLKFLSHKYAHYLCRSLINSKIGKKLNLLSKKFPMN